MAEEAMTGMAAPKEPMAPEATAETAPEKEPLIDMETLMGNFMDMPKDRRKIATRLLASPAANLVDEIIGEPVMARLIEQLGNPIPAGDTAPEEPAGMMTPPTEKKPMAEALMPAEDEVTTPPV
jgi:hypothetical protein